MKIYSQNMVKCGVREWENQILVGDCVEKMRAMPDASVDAVFADPPYNLQLGQKTLYRPEDQTAARAVRDDWDSFESVAAYDKFSRDWLTQVKRVLKPTGSLWVIGSYHNIFRLGAALQDMGFWILNDIVWVKTNPMPNFRGTRFTNAHETLIWATPTKTGKYTFNYDTMKKLNGGKQMRSDWNMDICLGGERVKDTDGKSLHPTQKPSDLLRRIILASTRAGDIILDPFFGSGTTGAVAKELGRKFIGIEQDANYVSAAQSRIASAHAVDLSDIEVPAKREEIRVAFAELLDAGLLFAGQTLVGLRGDRVMITRDGQLTHPIYGKNSIHIMAAKIQHTVSFNGWDYWSAQKNNGELVAIDSLRKMVRDAKTAMKKAA
ncbi:MAG: site-specific DNA-methyltransferase [Rickettsiales bacterium]|jgi:modification methylase|nr:site-specific DNA-methyltransferase [Rickettsiales bacterium]